jgi:uncharacterized membrane protein YfcA
MHKSVWKMVLCGSAAGCINGLFGAGGGMVLVPLLSKMKLEEQEVFPASISIILPMTVITLLISTRQAPLPWASAFPYLIGSAIGGVLAGFFGKKIPVLWLHRILGLLILYGAWRYLR